MAHKHTTRVVSGAGTRIKFQLMPTREDSGFRHGLTTDTTSATVTIHVDREQFEDAKERLKTLETKDGNIQTSVTFNRDNGTLTVTRRNYGNLDDHELVTQVESLTQNELDLLHRDIQTKMQGTEPGKPTGVIPRR